MKKTTLIAIVLCLSFSLTFSGRADSADPKLEAQARQALLAFKNKDGAALAKLVNPEQGLRFTAYAWDDLEQSVVLKGKELSGMYVSKKKYVWGVYDGSGDPISLTPAQYAKKFLWTADFTKVADKESGTLADYLKNRFSYIAGGSTGQLILERYPNARVFHYHFPGVSGPEGGAMDWSSLILIFVPAGSEWFLAGVVHNEWTI